MNKRGQITIFIIAAIVIVAMVILTLFIFRERIFPERLPIEIREVKEFTQDCIKMTANEALIFIGMQGGLAEPTLALETEIGNISYWVYNGTVTKPSISEIEESISEYMKYVLPLCTNRFYSFIEQGYVINESEILANTTIKEDKIDITIEYPLAIEKDEIKATLEDFSTLIPIAFPKIYAQAEKIAEMHKTAIDMDLLAQSKFDIAIMQYSEIDYIYTITDNRSIILDKPYTFMFAAR